MKQAIPGVAPAGVAEVPVMQIFPSISSFVVGRWLGRGFNIRFPDIYILRIGNLLALAGIPVALALYFFRLHPCVWGVSPHGGFYRLTNRRVQVLRNELNYDGSRALLGVICAVLLAVITPLVLYGVVGLIFTLGNLISGGSTYLDYFRANIFTLSTLVGGLIAFAGVVIGAAKGYAIGTFRFSYGKEVKSIQLDRFDSIDIEVKPGQEWFDAGDLVFRQGNTETFRLEGVSRPPAFRQSCIDAHRAFVGVKKALQQEAAAV